MADAQRLLSIQEGGAQRAWLQANAPTPDAVLEAELSTSVSSLRNSNPNESLRIAKIIELAAEFWQDPVTLAAANQALANSYCFLGNHVEAIDYFAAAADGFRTNSQLLRAAHVELRYIVSLIYIGEYKVAQEVAQRAQTILNNTEDIEARGRLEMNLGLLNYRMGDLKIADTHFVNANLLLERANRPEILAMMRVNHANVKIELDQFSTAQQYLNDARAVFSLSNLSQAVARVDANIAYLLFAQGQYEQALNLLGKARPIIESMGNPLELVTTDLHQSEIYLALNLWHEALHTAQSARKQLIEADRLPWEIGRLWLNESVALARDHQDYQTALSNARSVFSAEKNKYWLAIADLYEAVFAFHDNDFQTASEKARQASTSFDALGASTRVVRSQILLGNIALAQNDPSTASIHFNTAQHNLGHTQLPAFTYAIRYGLGRCGILQNAKVEALHYLRDAVDDLEKLQASITAEDFKIGYLSDKMQVYETLVQLCLEINTKESLEEAFATVERAKSRALLEAMARNDSKLTSRQNDSGEISDNDILGQMRVLQRELSWHYTKLNNPSEGSERSSRYLEMLNTAVNVREQQLHKLLRRLRTPTKIDNSYNSITPVTVKALQAEIPNGLLVLEYYTVDGNILVFGITTQGVWHIPLTIKLDSVNALLGQLRFQMNKFAYGERYRQRHRATLQQSCDDILLQLYDGLVAPLMDRVSAEKIVVVPHNILHYVPFHALYNGDDYLIDHHAISYAPSSTLFSRTLKPSNHYTAAAPRIVGIDDPTIPLAQDEAYAVAELFPKAELLVGDDATIANVTQSEVTPAFMHLSTHALFRSDNPSFSALKLRDGWLNVHDIYSMGRTPALVTLSACETGRHHVLRGDELIGLCRGFFATGARSLVVSLWKVEDEAAARLMSQFYLDLRDGMPVNQALQNAQLHIKKTKPHPYYWAPFVLTGNMDTRICQN